MIRQLETYLDTGGSGVVGWCVAERESGCMGAYRSDRRSLKCPRCFLSLGARTGRAFPNPGGAAKSSPQLDRVAGC